MAQSGTNPDIDTNSRKRECIVHLREQWMIADFLSLFYIVLYGAIVHGRSSVLSEYDTDSTGTAKDLSKLVLEKIELTDDKKV